jgi:hypothetical protein
MTEMEIMLGSEIVEKRYRLAIYDPKASSNQFGGFWKSSNVSMGAYRLLPRFV